MRRQIVSVAVAGYVAAALAAAVPKDPRAQAPADPRQQVLDLGKARVAAEIKHDAATLGRILDDKFLASFGAGKPYNKEEFVKLIMGNG